MSTLALKASGLCKRYGAVCAVDEVSFQVQHGEIVGLLGPNGAGKTTTINMVLGILQPSAGGSRSRVSTSGGNAHRRWRTPTSPPSTPRCPAT